MNSVQGNEFVRCALHPVGSWGSRGRSLREDWNIEDLRKEIRSLLPKDNSGYTQIGGALGFE